MTFDEYRSFKNISNLNENPFYMAQKNPLPPGEDTGGRGPSLARLLQLKPRVVAVTYL